MRTINEIIIHCSATTEGKGFTIEDIDSWHRQRGFKMVGYHYVIRLDGTIEQGRPLEQAGAHCKGHNTHSIGICYIGGLDTEGKPKDTRTKAQRDMLWALVKSLKVEHPKATIHGHNEFARKACPCFDAHAEYSQL